MMLSLLLCLDHYCSFSVLDKEGAFCACWYVDMLVLYEGARRLLFLSQPAGMPFGAKAYRPLVWGHSWRRCGAGSIIRVRKGSMPIATRGAVWDMRLMDDPTESYLIKIYPYCVPLLRNQKFEKKTTTQTNPTQSNSTHPTQRKNHVCVKNSGRK